MMNTEMAVSLQEELKLRRSFEFGAYSLIVQYLAKTYGLSELQKFAEFWAKTAAEDRRNIVEKSKQEFLAWEAKIEKVWIGREIKKLDNEGYIGVVKKCPLRFVTNKQCQDLPIDFFCDYVCSIIYPEGYRLLGFRSNIDKTKDGCEIAIHVS
jgi:hypothetical protein